MKRKVFFPIMLAIVIASMITQRYADGMLSLSIQLVLNTLLMIAGARRMKDAGRSPFWAGLVLVPFLGTCAIAVMAMKKTR